MVSTVMLEGKSSVGMHDDMSWMPGAGGVRGYKTKVILCSCYDRYLKKPEC